MGRRRSALLPLMHRPMTSSDRQNGRRIHRASFSPIQRCVALFITVASICVTALNEAHIGSIIFADAWVPSSNRPARCSTPTSSYSTPLRRPKTTRWYVHDNSESTQRSPPPTQNVGNEDQSQPSVQFKPKEQLDLRVLLIDNHDSYTYNLFQYISTMTKHPVQVVMNDAFSSWDAFVASLGSDSDSFLDHFDCIILSPGPGQPSQPADMGIVLDAIRMNANVPILGVCLGHQALGHAYGKEVKLSPCGPVHGLMSSVFYEETNDREGAIEQSLTCQLLRDLPQNFEVVRYHSLVVDFPDADNDSEIEAIAWCDSLKGPIDPDSSYAYNGKICMALRHKTNPHYGVQFHPESIGTGEAGYQLLWNFCEFAHQYKQRGNHELSPVPSLAQNDQTSISGEVVNGETTNGTFSPSRYRVLVHKIGSNKKGPSSLPLPKEVFEALYSSSPTSFWLDSSTGEAQFSKGRTDEGCPITSNSRFSIMGSNDGPLSRKIEYFGREHDPKIRGLRVVSNSGGEEILPNEDILSYLRQQIEGERELIDTADVITFDESHTHSDPGYTLRTVDEFGGASDQVPFDYRGGYVGYLGYEVRHDTQCWIFQQEGGLGCTASDGRASPGATNPTIPTAAFLFADQSLLYDHQTGDWYIIGVAENDHEGVGAETDQSGGTSVDDTISWMHKMQSEIQSMRGNAKASDAIELAGANLGIGGVQFVPSRSKAQYQKDIARSHEEIRNGESYELCVTNQLEAEFSLPKQATKATHETPFGLYKLLREKNPAPFSAFMNFYRDGAPQNGHGSVSICCSSPERFLSVNKAQRMVDRANLNQPSPTRQFVVESKPIKGTAARYTGESSDGMKEPDDVVQRIDSEVAASLRESVKDRAENLMIVDLLRNDLGRVCQVGSVHVPKLMHIESYATVHQMVSTVRGSLDGDASNAIDVIEACFPGGSMTGAPKQRTMEILDEIEQGASRGPYSGCLGYISLNGCMDMNIIIRSSVLTPNDPDELGTETWKASIGCGGAITALSNSEDEYEEMLLKSRVVRRTISEWVSEAMAKDTPQLDPADDVEVVR